MAPTGVLARQYADKTGPLLSQAGMSWALLTGATPAAEREPEPSERQRQLARTMIDAGADVVVGSHPHVTQGAEYYRGKLIVYSLGNFVFDGFELPAAKRGWLLRLTLGRQGLLAWETLAAQMDEEGTPHPVPGALTPCGESGRAAGEAITANPKAG